MLDNGHIPDQETDMLKIRSAAITFFITVMLIHTCTAAVYDHEWDTTTCILSYSNPVIDKDGYSIEVVDFDGYGTVQINLLHEDSIIDSIVVRNNDTDWYTADNGEFKFKGLRITDQEELLGIGSWPDDPKAEIRIQTQREQTNSKISVEIDIDEDEYLLDEIVNAEVTVRNIGEMDVHDVQLTIIGNGLYTDDALEYLFSRIEDGSSHSKVIKFGFTQMLSDNISIVATVTCEDEKQFTSENEVIDIEQPLTISKTMTVCGNQTDTFYSSIGVTNDQTRTMHIVLADVLPMGFTLINGSITDNKPDLIWEFDIDPDETKIFSYQSITNRPAVYRVPKPHAKCIIGEKVQIVTPEYSSIITVHQSEDIGKGMIIN